MIRHEDLRTLPSGVEIRCCANKTCTTFVRPIAIPIDVGEGYEIGVCYVRESNDERIGPEFRAVAEAKIWIGERLAELRSEGAS